VLRTPQHSVKIFYTEENAEKLGTGEESFALRSVDEKFSFCFFAFYFPYIDLLAEWEGVF